MSHCTHSYVPFFRKKKRGSTTQRRERQAASPKVRTQHHPREESTTTHKEEENGGTTQRSTTQRRTSLRRRSRVVQPEPHRLFFFFGASQIAFGICVFLALVHVQVVFNRGRSAFSRNEVTRYSQVDHVIARLFGRCCAVLPSLPYLALHYLGVCCSDIAVPCNVWCWEREKGTLKDGRAGRGTRTGE